jgi:hypothetical protein
MISSVQTNEHCQTYSCWLAARHSQARIRTLNSPTDALANTWQRGDVVGADNAGAP